MLNRNHYMSVKDHVSVLLVESEDFEEGNFTVVLHEETLLVVNKNEFRIQ